MTSFNGARHLAQQVDSILSQSMRDLELVISDDGSQDETKNILRSFVGRDHRIRLFENDVNLGLHKNLEKALRLTRAPYIAIADQDDVWKPHKLGKLLSAICKYDAVYSDSSLIDEVGNPLGVTMMDRLYIPKPISGTVGGFALLRHNSVSGHALLFRRELLDIVLPFDEDMMYDHQIAFTALTGNGLCYIDEPLVLHRVHSSNLNNASLNSDEGVENPYLVNDSERGVSRKYSKEVKFLKALSKKVNLLGRPRSPLLKIRNFLIRKLATRLSKIDEVNLDFGIALLLVLLRKHFTYPDTLLPLKYCLDSAKGGKYYDKKRHKKVG